MNILECPKAFQLAGCITFPLYGSKEGEGKMVPIVMKPSVQTDYAFMESLKKLSQYISACQNGHSQAHTKN